MVETFKEKVILITGAGSGIGRSTAINLSSKGAITVLMGRTESKLIETQKEIESFGGKSLIKVVDVKDRESVKKSVEEVVNEYGDIYALFCNAGITAPPTNTAELNMDHFSNVINTHMYGTINLIKESVPYMENHGGRIVLCSSLGATVGLVGNQAYCMAKGAMLGLMKSLAKELGPKKITVNTVIPGIISTDMTSPMKSASTVEEIIISDTPIGRFGEPDDVANAVAFFMEPTSEFITGAELIIDGGYSLETSSDKLMRDFISL